jgi:polyisoprenoid-binding protein YceI
VRGAFNEFEGTAHIDEDLSKSSTKLVINVDSIDTRNADRDGHLRTNDFLDIENHPQITFESTSVRQLDDVTVQVSGDLTIKGVSKPVTIDFEYQGQATDPFGNQRVGFEGAVTINRKDWGITWNAALETGGVLVSDKVTLEFEVSAVKNA